MNHNKYNKSRSSRKHPINTMIDDLLSRSISEFIGSDVVSSRPAVNTLKEATGYKIELAAPGLEKSDFKIDIEKDQLVVSVSKEKSKAADDQHYTRHEFNYNSFSRSFNLSEDINKDAIAATYENGILILWLPFKEESEADKKRTINIV